MRVLEGAAAFLLLLLMLVVLVDVVGRNLFNRPLPWGTEFLEIVLAGMIFLLYPVLAWAGGHITVDLIDTRPSIQRAQRTLAGVVGAVLFALIAWCLGRQALRAAGYGEATPILGIPLGAVLAGMSILGGAAALAFVAATARAWRGRDAGQPHPIEAI